ncbi:MAG: SLC13 family permease, partial [Promethearchaeota archaeon]
IAIFILLITSILSGFLDNAPVTIIFIPIMWVLIGSAGLPPTPLLVAFILGINLGGNFLPQGSACDMMTLELAKKNGVKDVNYKKLLKVGGLFALLHIILGIMYLAFIIYVFPVY